MTDDDRPPQPEDLPPGPGTSGPTAASQPPPLTAFAWRHGLVRPTQGRLLAGVCGALARATNTDPILWRVIISVLTIFGGFGVLAYLLGWLLLPADGDTASPVEALLGRGQSATSTVLTMIAGVIALLSVGAFVSEPLRPGIIVAGLLTAAVLLLMRDQRGRSRPVPAPTATRWAGGGPSSVPLVPPTPGDPAAAGAGGPQSALPPQPPFAPHGPFAPGGPPPRPPLWPPFTPPQPPPAPKPPRSRLGRLVFSLLLLVVGTLTAIDLGYRQIPAHGYLVAALATVAIGLIIGAWYGRARGLIGLGIVLSLALPTVAGASRIHNGWHGGSVSWAPTSASQLQSSYGQDVGDLRLDLTKVDFPSTGPINLDVRVDVGSAVIVLPPNVDVIVDASLDVGDAKVLGQNWNGLGLDPKTVEDTGADGPGGGKLHLSAKVNLGSLEVTR
jgi:phage shock protein PspC (stress-responsive transcriptional regulator)